MSIPLRAPNAVEMVFTTGIASPSAWGQAMTSTVTASVRAKTNDCSARRNQNRKVPSPTTTATMVSQWAARSANRWTGGLEAWASLTSAMICARAVSSPVRVTRTRSAPSPLSVPPTAGSPGPLSTGFDSPVIMASLTLLRPSTTSPSMGTFSPGRTSKRSPTCTSEVGTSFTPPSTMRLAVGGISLTSSCSAPAVPRTARISSQWPRRSTTTRVLISQ